MRKLSRRHAVKRCLLIVVLLCAGSRSEGWVRVAKGHQEPAHKPAANAEERPEAAPGGGAPSPADASHALAPAPVGTLLQGGVSGKEKDDGKKQSLRERLTPEWINVFAALCNLGVVAATWFVIRRQANLLQRQVGVMERQTGVMETQDGRMAESIEVARDAAVASKRSAEAAFQNIRLFIDKERARMIFRPAAPEVHKLRNPVGEPITRLRVTAIIEHFGSTQALTPHGRMAVQISDTPEFDAQKARWTDFNLPTIVDDETLLDPPTIGRDLEESLWDDLLANDKYLHFAMQLRYRDVFDLTHSDERIYLWRPRKIMPFGKWVRMDGAE